MNLSNRVFAILGNDTIIKIPNNKYLRFRDFNNPIDFPEFANKKIKIAVFLIELKNRKPFRILNEYYNYYEFDKYGRLDRNKYFEQLRVNLNTVDFFDPIRQEMESNPNVIDATKEFYRKRLETQYQWSPTNILRNKMHKLIFK